MFLFFFCRSFLADNDNFLVPDVINELSTQEVLTTEYVEGLPLDQCVDLDQDVRNKVSFLETFQAQGGKCPS